MIWKATLKLWDRAEQAIVGILGLAALACAVWQVLSRYFFPQQSIGYAEEVIVYLLIWAVMIVSSQLVRTDSHVRPDVLRNVLPAALARWLELFNCAGAVVFCGALTWYGWQIVATASAIDERSASDLRFPMWVYYAALPAGGALMAIRYAIRLFALAAARDPDLLRQRHLGGHERPDID
jgi:C4-dicarboxylate transporter DctQ subunit